MRRVLASTGIATVAAFANAAAAPAAPKTANAAGKRVEPQLTAVVAPNVIPMPTKESKRGSTSLYPFDSLTAVGMSFGVKNKTAAQLSSIVSNANRKAMVNKTDAAGNVVYKTTPLKDANGNVVGQAPTTEPEKIAGKHFFAVDVADLDAARQKALKGTPLEGSMALIFRDK